MKIKIITDATGPMEAMLTTENPVTAKSFLDALPITGRANTWGDEIRPASEVNVFGRIEGNPKVFKMVRSGKEVTIEVA